MKSSTINTFKKLSSTTIATVILIFYNSIVLADTFDLNAYKPIQLPESNRKKLPETVRSKLAPEIQDIIERSPITTQSPPAKRGYELKFETNDGFSVLKYDINCKPLSSGLLNCSKLVMSGTRIKPRTQERGIYAFGGLVRLYNAPFVYEQEISMPVSNIKYDSIKTPALPSPGLDILIDDPYGLQSLRCVSATMQLVTPSILNEKGKVSLLACGSIIPDKDDDFGTEIKQLFKNHNPGVYGGALYFWIENAGIALPATIFYPNQIKGYSFKGYQNLWVGTVNGGGGFGPQMQNVNFKWSE